MDGTDLATQRGQRSDQPAHPPRAAERRQLCRTLRSRHYATKATIEPYRIYNREITITGSMAVLHSFERAADLFAAGVLDPEVFISHRLPLHEYPEAMNQFASGVGRKIQVRP